MATSVSLVLVVACLASLGSAAPKLQPTNVEDGNVVEFHSPVDFGQKWKSFKEQYGKKYSGVAEEEKRKNIFVKNLKDIEEHNSLYAKGLTTYTMGINKFTDLEFSEFLERMTCDSFDNATEVSVVEDDSEFSEEDSLIPEEIDWRRKGYVTRVKDQDGCGSCWAFSAVAVLEGQHYRKTGNLVELSEQNLVDCSSRFGNHGCNGGLAMMAFNYILFQGGIDTEQSYPYEATQRRCRFKRATVGATCSGFIKIPGEKNLKKAMAQNGPVSVSIQVLWSFVHYKSGIYYEPSCSSTRLNHAVLAVGYGLGNNNNYYWIVKNSWGDGWGDKGYVLMSRNRNNNCGIATRPVLPIV